MAVNADLVWDAGPARPLLAEHAVHVWRADLEVVDDELCELLDPEERARAGRLLRPLDRRRWPRARGVLRALLGLYLDVDPRALRFHEGTHGKPSLAPPVLSFNLSHSADVALYAIAADAAVGVDVELARRPRDMLAIAARIFGASEAERLRAFTPEQRTQEFLRAWVRHEAELKRRGHGLGAEAPLDGPTGWIAELDIGPGGAAALAVDGTPGELHCWTWPPERTSHMRI